MFPSMVKSQPGVKPVGSSGYKIINGFVAVPFVGITVRKLPTGAPTAGDDRFDAAVESRRKKGLLSVAGMTSNCDYGCIHFIQSIEVVNCPLGTPSPCQ